MGSGASSVKDAKKAIAEAEAEIHEHSAILLEVRNTVESKLFASLDEDWQDGREGQAILREKECLIFTAGTSAWDKTYAIVRRDNPEGGSSFHVVAFRTEVSIEVVESDIHVLREAVENEWVPEEPTKAIKRLLDELSVKYEGGE